MTPRISIVLPVRNDAEALGRTLDALPRVRGMEAAEVIVAAAGDPEGTARVVGDRAGLIWPLGSTRAALMNAGAAAARDETLFFLHADSFPPPNALGLIGRALRDTRVAGGAFDHLFTEPVWSLRAITAINRIRYRVTRNYYGDQGIFVRAAAFRRLGGYRPMGVLEDLDFTQRLQRAGRAVLIPVPLRTSGRRFLARGPWRTFFAIVWLLTLHTLRIETEGYAEWYRGPAHRAPGSPWPTGGAWPTPNPGHADPGRKGRMTGLVAPRGRPASSLHPSAAAPEANGARGLAGRLLQAFLRRYASRCVRTSLLVAGEEAWTASI